MSTPADSAPTTSVRPARVEDVPVIAQFVRELADYERLSHEAIADEAALQRGLFGNRPVAEAVLAHAGSVPAGFALFFHTFSTFLGKPGLYLEDLYVRADMRGKGIGRMLLRHLARLAVERGCGRLEWAVLDWNDPAIRFYEKLGAKPQSDWTVYRLTGERLAAFGTGSRA